MAVDTAQYVGDFDTSKPTTADPKVEGPANYQQVKLAAKQSFPNVKGSVSATHTELSYVAGVTSAIQTQLDAKGAKAGQVWTGTHDFTAATTNVATAAALTNTAQAASTAFVQTAIAAVNAVSGNLVRSTNNTASFSVSAGQMVAATYTAGAVAATFPPSPTVGQVAGVWFDNGRFDNTVNLGANSVIGLNGVTVSGVVTIDSPMPVVWAWYGDYWRAA